MMPLLIYPEEFEDEEDNPHESPSNPPSAEPAPEPVPPSKKHTEESTSEPNYDDLSGSSVPTRVGSMEQLSPKDIERNQKESY